MSAAGHSHDGDAPEAHGFTYEGIPASKPQPDEPRSPGWLPLLGIGILLALLFGYVVSRPEAETETELQPEPAVEPAQAAAPSPGRPTSGAGEKAPTPPALGAALKRMARPQGAASGVLAAQPPRAPAKAGADPHDHEH